MSKLAALVAVRVMGWHSIVGGWGKWYNDKGQHEVLPEQWNPHASMDDAWAVVAKMRERGWLFKIDDSGRDRELTVVWFHYSRDGFTIDAEAVAKSVVGKEPEAICIAALRACGVPEAEIEEARKQ